MHGVRVTSLRQILSSLPVSADAGFKDRGAQIALAAIAGGSCFSGGGRAAAGRTVLLATHGQLASALAMVALDGLARRIVICPPDLSDAGKAAIAARAGVDLIVVDTPFEPIPELASLELLACCVDNVTKCHATTPAISTEWILLTSGTSGVPKAVRHSLSTLTGAIAPASTNEPAIVWSTFYDIRRYGGLQILLRAVLGGRSLMLSNDEETMADFLVRAGAGGVTHLTGTPSHWRRALMSPAIAAISPGYIRLSGEIADQAILDALKSSFPRAQINHAYASTEAGVVFVVSDGLEGFPASLAGVDKDGMEMRVVDGALHVRSGRTALDYVGKDAPELLDRDGFVDTGDMVERRGERYYFAGRRGGIINIGGAKVHPEEVETVINRQAGVRVSMVRGRSNPITGAIVGAEVVLKDSARAADGAAMQAVIVEACRAELAAYKVPTSIRFVPDLPMSPNGKLLRRDV